MDSKAKIKTDCFAYKNNDCIALNELYCAKENCSFYKTHQQIRERELQLSKRNK